MSNLTLSELVCRFLANTDLNGVVAILLLGLDGSDLAAIHLDDGAGYDRTPLVPEVSHTDLVSKDTRSLAQTTSGLGPLQV